MTRQLVMRIQPRDMNASDMRGLALRPIAPVGRSLVALASATRQGAAGAPEAQLVIDAGFVAGLTGIAPGDELLVLTWLDRASRDVLAVQPRGDLDRPQQGV